MKEKIVNIIKIIFGIGTLLCLIVGGLSFFGYLVALITNGETAVKICKFIYKDMYPVLVVTSTCMVILGVIKMYICGETKRKKKTTEEKKD